jgi:cell division protein FtsL
MLQIVSTCDTSAYEQTGAYVVAVIFLSVFVALILGDAVLTALALRAAMTKDERLQELNARIQEKERYRASLQASIAELERHNGHVFRGATSNPQF